MPSADENPFSPPKIHVASPVDVAMAKVGWATVLGMRMPSAKPGRYSGPEFRPVIHYALLI